jgi:hypothetical protein
MGIFTEEEARAKIKPGQKDEFFCSSLVILLILAFTVRVTATEF